MQQPFLRVQKIFHKHMAKLPVAAIKNDDWSLEKATGVGNC